MRDRVEELMKELVDAIQWIAFGIWLLVLISMFNLSSISSNILDTKQQLEKMNKTINMIQQDYRHHNYYK